MSKELNQIRSKLASINSLLKQDKLLAAATALHESLGLYLRQSLLSQEKQEFQRLLEQAVYHLSTVDKLKQVYPLVISYEPGSEKALADQIRDLLAELQNSLTDEAQFKLAELEKQKRIQMEKGQHHLDKGEFEPARKVFDQLVLDHGEDTALAVDIGEKFLTVQRYEDAIHFLEKGRKNDPNAVHVLNRLGMALRKMRRFEEAEKCYLEGLERDPQDEFLFFNLGRVYIDWQKWDEAAATAERALDINQGFQEAVKMLAYARKKMGA